MLFAAVSCVAEACCLLECLLPENFSPLFVAEGRIGNNRTVPGHAYGTHEMAITGADPRCWRVHEIGQFVWSSGHPTLFEIEYEPSTRIARFTLGGTTSAWHLVETSPTGSFVIVLFAKAVRANSSLQIGNVSVNGTAVSVALDASGDSLSFDTAEIAAPGLAGRLHIRGYAALTFPPGAGRPNNSQLQFLVVVGTRNSEEPPIDSDGDGLPDAWEREHFGDPASCDPNDDADGDGATNADEYWAGTDPADPVSRFNIAVTRTTVTDPARSNPSESQVVPVISWPSASNRTYSVWRATTLSRGAAGFSLLQSEIPGSPPYNMLTDSTATGAGPYYYRVQVHRAP